MPVKLKPLYTCRRGPTCCKLQKKMTAKELRAFSPSLARDHGPANIPIVALPEKKVITIDVLGKTLTEQQARAIIEAAYALHADLREYGVPQECGAEHGPCEPMDCSNSNGGALHGALVLAGLVED